MSTSSKDSYPTSNAGYVQHWSRLGERLDAIRRAELRQHGPRNFDWQIVDSLLQLGYLHGNRNRASGLVQWQQRIAEAYARQATRKDSD